MCEHNGFRISSDSVQSLSHVRLCHPMDCSMPGLPVHHQLPEFTQTHVHWVSDAIQPSYPLSFPSPPTFNLSQHQGLFNWVSSEHQVAKVVEFQFLISLWLWRFNEIWQSLSLSSKFNVLTMHWVFLKGYNHWMLVWCCSTVLFQEVYKSIFIPNWLPQFYFSKQMLLVLHPFFNFSSCKRCSFMIST